MNQQGLRWSVHCVANVGPGKRLNLYKRGFKIYDLLVSIIIVVVVVVCYNYNQLITNGLRAPQEMSTVVLMIDI